MNNVFGLKCDFRFCEDFLFLSLILPALFCHSLQRNMVFDVIPFWMRWTIFQLIFRTKPNFVKRNCISQLDRHLLGSFFLLHSNFGIRFFMHSPIFATGHSFCHISFTWKLKLIVLFDAPRSLRKSRTIVYSI